MLILPLYNLYIIKIGKITFFISVNNYLLFYSPNSRIFSLTNVLLILTMAAAAAVAAAAEAATETYIIVALARMSFLILFTVLIIFWSYPFTPVPSFFAR